MGRFLNSRFIAAEPVSTGARITIPSDAIAAPATTAPEAITSIVAPRSETGSSIFSSVGLYALGIYLISGYATDLSYRFLGSKPYVSMASGIIVFLCFLLSGRALNALNTTVGKLWLAFGGWVLLSVVFSRWPGGSLELMQTYIPKYYMVLFYAAAFVFTAEHVRTLFRAAMLGGFVLLLVCVFFGSAGGDSGRFVIPTNIQLLNPNDLALELLLACSYFLFIVRQPSKLGRLAGVIGLFGAGYFLVKTGSRGGMLAMALFIGLCIFFNENRARLVVLALPVVLIIAAMTPQATLHRLSLIFVDPGDQQTTTTEEEKTVQSQIARMHLLKTSIKYAVTHPLFGIGPGRFADAIWEDGKKEGRHEASLGTHNTYTQVAAECGVPALLLFVSAILVTIRRNYRLYRFTRNDRPHQLLSDIAFTCFVMTTAYSIDMFFHHMAYAGSMATVLGLGVITEIAARNAGVEVPRARIPV